MLSKHNWCQWNVEKIRKCNLLSNRFVIVVFNGYLLKNNSPLVASQKASGKMKVLGIDDNSEAFSLLLTAIAGVLLFLFAYLLNKRVMGSKINSDVSVASPRGIKISISLFDDHRIRRCWVESRCSMGSAKRQRKISRSWTDVVIRRRKTLPCSASGDEAPNKITITLSLIR